MIIDGRLKRNEKMLASQSFKGFPGSSANQRKILTQTLEIKIKK